MNNYHYDFQNHSVLVRTCSDTAQVNNEHIFTFVVFFARLSLVKKNEKREKTTNVKICHLR